MAKRKGTDDYGYEKTDEQLNDLEARLSSLYTDASKEMEKKLGEFLSQYQEKDDQQRALVKEGKLTEEEYKKWRQGQIFQTKKMQAQVDNLTETLVNTDKLAMQMVNGELPSVYANNYNFQGYKAEKMAQAGGEDYSSFTIYNADAVARLATKDPDLLPAPRVDIPKDTKWNKTKINTAISQGIIQGEPIDKIASRLIDVTDMDYNAAVRNARTAVIGAQNAGRADASERVKEAGYEMVDVWSATYDQRTRDTHIALDGQERQPDGYFHTFTGELLAYPCDPNGAPEEVYNCRCRLNSIIKGIDHSKDDELYAQFMEENYYDDWLVVKEQTEAKKELFEINKAAMELSKSTEENISNVKVSQLDFAGKDNVNDVLVSMKHEENVSWNNYINKGDYVINSAESGTPAYDPNTGKVTLFTDTTSGTFFHETAHSMDNDSVEIKYNYTNKMVDPVTKEIYENKSDYSYKGSASGAATILYDLNPDSREIDSEAIMKFAGIDSLDVTKENLHSLRLAIEEFGEKYGEESMVALSDLIDAHTQGDFPLTFFTGGHGKDFWTTDALRVQRESWAEVCELKAIGNNESFEAVKEILPQRVGANGRIYNLLFEGGSNVTNTTVTDQGYRIYEEILNIGKAD